MNCIHKKHPIREACIVEVVLIGHDKVRIEIGYTTRSKDNETYHREILEFTLCDIEFLGIRLHHIIKELQNKLDEFKRAISGG